MHRRTVWMWAGAGLMGLVVGCGQAASTTSSAPAGGSGAAMAPMMGEPKMSEPKMNDGMMPSEKMAGEKMAGEKMAGEKMMADPKMSDGMMAPAMKSDDKMKSPATMAPDMASEKK